MAQGAPRRLFTKAFYRLLANHFGHIAHYSEHGFWDYYFTDERGKAEFLEVTVPYVACDDPAYTFSDVETTVQRRIHESGILDWQKRAGQGEIEAIERALLKKLQAKYEPRAALPDASHPSEAPCIPTVQTDLFG